MRTSRRATIRAPFVHFATALALLLFVSCGSPTQPGPTPPPPPPPNDAPKIESIRLSASRVEVTQTVTATATVTDAETPVSALSLTWEASAGTVVQNGLTATWTFPASLTTPAQPTLTLIVVETYGGGAFQIRENRVTGTAPTLYVHNSTKEIEALVNDFLEKFTDSTVSPEDAVSEFSDSCPGKEDEYEDIADNREEYRILSASWTISRVRLNSARTSADIRASCEFRSRRLEDGDVGTVRGTCELTAVYRQNRWWLCDSHFNAAAGSAFPTFRF